MKTFVELVTEIKKSFDQEDNKVLANIEDSIESTTVATSNHALGSYFIYGKKVYEVTTAISVGDTLVIYPATGYNIKVADDIMAMIETLRTENQTLTNQVKDMNNVLGAKNLLPFDLEYIKKIHRSGIWVGNSYTIYGVTFTLETDDCGNLLDIKINGTSNNYITFYIYEGKLAKGEYIISNHNSQKNALFYSINSGSAIQIVDHSDFTLNEDAIIRAWIYLGVPSYNDNVLVYPMIRLASISDDTYVPYAKTNRELTEQTASIESDISAINTQLSQLDFDGAGAHNSIYRGKYLGAEVTAEQYAHIADGTFKDMYIGDYWTIGGVNYRIGHFDYWYNTGDTACTTHNVLLVPDTNLASGKMNSTDTTAGGYVGSDLKTGANNNTALATAKNIITTAFGSAHILTHREYFTNAVTNGKPSAGAWYDSDIDLMNENMVYGTNIFLPHPDGSTVPNLYTIDKTQIKLFAERPDLITIRAAWWLRDVVSAAGFADVYTYGYAYYDYASTSVGVRPAFGLRA